MEAEEEIKRLRKIRLSLLDSENFCTRFETGLRTHVPPHMRNSVRDYLFDAVPPGGFLTALLEKADWVQVFEKADIENREALFQWASFMYSNIPMGCWGSKEQVRMWLATRG